MTDLSSAKHDRILFVTGRLAAPALQSLVSSLASRIGFEASVYVAKISVAALISIPWLVRFLKVPGHVNRVILPGCCRGDLDVLRTAYPNVQVERGPEDMMDLATYLDASIEEELPYGDFRIEILSEINHANHLSSEDLLLLAARLRSAGADVIDLGGTPGEEWPHLRDSVCRLRDAGHRVSIDSFEKSEVLDAVSGGAELVLSVNSQNVEASKDWGVEVVAIPDRADGPNWLKEIVQTVDRLVALGVPFRVDPVVSPIGFGFAESLGRYLRLREVMPAAKMLMGVGNLTELTASDSGGVNALLIGFCEELGIESVLTTEVANWAQGSTAEIDVARRLMHYAVAHGRLPKHIDPRLVQLRDERVRSRGISELKRLQEGIKDRNFRLFAEDGRIFALNGEVFESDEDAFQLFHRLDVSDPSHAFYLGWEMMKATLSLQLGKTYTQDRALRWGLLTREEKGHRAVNRDPGRQSRGEDPQ